MIRKRRISDIIISCILRYSLRERATYKFYFENSIFYFWNLLWKQKTICLKIPSYFQYVFVLFAKRKSSAKTIYSLYIQLNIFPCLCIREIVFLFWLILKYVFFYLIFYGTKYYSTVDDRKMSITRENDDKTARRSFVYKIPGRYFRCNAFSQIHGCPSLGTKSHGSISRAKALHACEISERRQRAEFLETAIHAVKL